MTDRERDTSLKRGWIACKCGSPHPGWWSHGMKMSDVLKHLALPKGWRWLKVGEHPRRGDVMVDVRTKPVVITQDHAALCRCRCVQCDAAHGLTQSHHPVRRRIRRGVSR